LPHPVGMIVSGLIAEDKATSDRSVAIVPSSLFA
jgi:hypothetical protein